VRSWYDVHEHPLIAQLLTLTFRAVLSVCALSSGAFLLAFLAAFDAGDRVAVASASYPCYRNILNALGYVTIT
jgi:aspartate/methionine/tyrosine aminotransferase